MHYQHGGLIKIFHAVWKGNACNDQAGKKQPMNSIREIIHIGLLITNGWKGRQMDATKCITSLLP